MSQYLAQELGQLGVDDEAILEYCEGLLKDDSMDDEEKVEAITGYLEAVIPNQDFSAAVSKALDKLSDEKKKQQAEDQRTAQIALSQALEKEKEELKRDAQLAQQHLQHQQKPNRQLTAEERKQREKLIAAYDYHGVEIVERADGEAEIMIKEQTKDGNDAGLQKNNNAQIIAEKERAARESSRNAHQKKVEREKELLELDRLRKEKEKRRTMKKEKRRM
ncbi:hypothetical protein LPJ64_005298 [Coemansia asiatica]|uniref:CCDC43 PWI-like domain-containing protein n=1 Tax=Coemansia asiatica TaxID=1052880 RepID=A0A9W7XHB2_9FUNG|nr:hypothetical protein LPJ64_005298 [Coemansia asiatica]